MVRPKVLMLDEPSLGLAPLLVKDIFDIIKEIHSQGNTILLVEQNAKKALGDSRLWICAETGELVLEGPGQELLNNERVKEAILEKLNKQLTMDNFNQFTIINAQFTIVKARY